MRVRERIGELASEQATGGLVVAGEPGGVVYFVDGTVNGVESPAAPGVDSLLVAGGKVAERAWEELPQPPGPALVESGRLGAAQLELCALGALFDAAYFTLSTESATLRFDPAARFWLGPVCRVEADALCDDIDRRRRILDAVFASDVNDSVPVVPIRRPGLDRVLLSGLQWEIVLHADGRRTPTELAHLLGRSAYAVLLDVRRLAAAGLIEQPESEPAPAEPAPPLPKRVPGAHVFEPPPPPPTRRALPAGTSAFTVLPGAIDKAPDDSLLKRIRSALQSLR